MKVTQRKSISFDAVINGCGYVWKIVGDKEYAIKKYTLDLKNAYSRNEPFPMKCIRVIDADDDIKPHDVICFVKDLYFDTYTLRFDGLYFSQEELQCSIDNMKHDLLSVIRRQESQIEGIKRSLDDNKKRLASIPNAF